MIEGLRTYRLGDISTFKYGTLPKKELIRSRSDYPIFTGYRISGTYPYANCEKGDLIVVARGVGGTGDVKLCPVKCWLTNLSIIIKPDSSILDNKYFYYKYLSNNLKYLDSGSAQSQITIGDLERIEVTLPNLIEQSRIASILSSLDDKIELNLQTNKTLEALTQAIFKEWFVDFRFPGFDGEMADVLPKGWKTGEIKDICLNVRSTYNPNKTNLDFRYVGLEHIPRQSISLLNWGQSADIDSQKSRFVQGDVLFGKLRPYFHKVVIAPFDGICSTDVLVLRAKWNKSQNYLLMHLSSDSCIKYAISQSDGTRMPRVNWDSLSKFSIIIPSDEILMQFQNITNVFIKRALANVIENQTLIKIRDTILPKLMTGKIKVA